MAIFRQFSFSSKDITAQVSDKVSNFEWIAYSQDSGVCNIKKQSAFSPNQIYYNLSRSVLNIPKMCLNTSSLFVAYNDDTLIGEIISLINPLTSTTEINIPGGIIETPVDIINQDSNLFFLLPGIISGENAKVIKYDTSGNFDQIIDLTKTGEIVYNASTFTIDDNGDIWIVTNTNPATVVRVYDTGGNIWDFATTIIDS